MNGKKTYLTAAAALLTTWAAFLTGNLTLSESLQATFAAVLAATLRHGITTGAPLILACVFSCLPLLTGCTAPGGPVSADLLNGVCIKQEGWVICYNPLTETGTARLPDGTGGTLRLTYDKNTRVWRGHWPDGSTLVWDGHGRPVVEPPLPQK